MWFKKIQISICNIIITQLLMKVAETDVQQAGVMRKLTWLD